MSETAVNMKRHTAATVEVNDRANANKALRDAEEPGLIRDIEKFFEPALKWFFAELRRGGIQPWPSKQAPTAEVYRVHFASVWRDTYRSFLWEQVVPTGSSTLEVPLHVGMDLWPRELRRAPVASVHEYFVLSAQALHDIGMCARSTANVNFPTAAARWLELLGYNVKI
jgi:hypothetical protein